MIIEVGNNKKISKNIESLSYIIEKFDKILIKFVNDSVL